MKFNFKKITAIATSLLVTGMTMGVAAAANFPAPFSDGTSSATGVVYGADAASTDYAAVVNINDYLRTKVSSSGGTPTGDFVLLERSTDKFNLNDDMNSFYSKIDEGEFTTVLAKGTYVNDDYEDFDYEQEIVLGAGMKLKHFLDSDFNGDEPIIGFDLSSGQHLFNYTLKFTPDDAQGTDTSWSGITNSYLPLFNQEYYVLSMTNTTGTNHKISLLNSAASSTLDEGESTILTIGTETYDVSCDFVGASTARFTVNGQSTDSLSAGETQKVGDIYMGVKSIDAQQWAEGVKRVDFALGSGKLVLENTKEIEINNEKLSAVDYAVVGSDEIVSYKVYSHISTSGNNIDSITLDWELADDSWIAPGTEMALPGFETVKLYMGDFITDKAESTKLEGDSKKLTLSTTLSDGALDLHVFYLNSSSTGIEGLGKDATHQFVTGNGTAGGTTLSSGIAIALNETLNNYFVATWINGDDFESYAYKLESVDEDDSNKTILTNLISGGTDITLDEAGDYDTDGNVKFTLDFAEEKYPSKAYVVLNVSAASSGAVYTNKLVTTEGLLISLPVSIDGTTAVATAPSTGNGYLNFTDIHPTAWTMNFSEEDKQETIGAGNYFTVAMGFSGTDGIQPATIGGNLSTSTMHETYDDSDEWEGYVQSDLATYLLHSKPTSGLDDLEITYHGSEAYGEVYIAEIGSTIGSAGNMIFKDSEKSLWQDRNVVLVGGSCINSATAEKLGGALCDTAFTDATGIGAGEFMIASYDGFATGKIALVVAGYEAADTSKAADMLIDASQTIDTTANKVYKGTTAMEEGSVLTEA